MDFVKSLNDNLDSFDTGNPPPKYPSKSNSSSMVSSLIGAGSSLLNGVMGLFTNNANKKENRRQREFAHNEAELQFQRQQQLINQQNEYNSFSNQRKLMEEAGYNPNQFVGNNAGTAVSQGGSAQGAATPGVMPMQSPQFNFAKDIAELKSVESQTRLNNAQALKLTAEAKEIAPNAISSRNLNSALGRNYDYSSESISRSNRLFDSTFDSQVSKFLSDSLNSRWQVLLTKANLWNTFQSMDIDRQTFQYMIEKRWPAEIDEIQSRINVNKASATLSLSSASAALAQASLFRAQESGQKIKNNYDKAVLNSPEYRQAQIDLAVAIAKYNSAHASNEEKGLPYLTTTSNSYNYSGLSVSTSESNTQVTNPVTGEVISSNGRQVSQQVVTDLFHQFEHSNSFTPQSKEELDLLKSYVSAQAALLDRKESDALWRKYHQCEANYYYLFK